MSEKITEHIEFLTQIHTAWDGAEQRVALRGNPRRFVSYEYVGVNTRQSQYLRALTSGTQTQLLQFPLWHANTVLEKIVYDRQSIVPLKKEDAWNYRDCASVLLWENDEEGGEFFDVKNVTADGVLHLKKQVSSDWRAFQTIAVPVFWGVMRQEDQYANLTSKLTSMTINVEFINRGTTIELPAAAGPVDSSRPVFPASKNASAEYLGRELFMAPPSWEEDIGCGYSRNANRLDNQTGVVRYDLKSNDTAESRSVMYRTANREEIHFLQRFFYRNKGRFKAFYAPTWVNDVELAEDASEGNALIAKFPFYWKYYELNKRRRRLIVFFKDGTIEILQIAGFSLDDTRKRGKIFLDMPIRRAMVRRQIRMISFLCLYRLADDSLTTEYETTGIASIRLEFAEVAD